MVLGWLVQSESPGLLPRERWTIKSSATDHHHKQTVNRKQWDQACFFVTRSTLAIGSIAGVTLMSMEHVGFLWCQGSSRMALTPWPKVIEREIAERHPWFLRFWGCSLFSFCIKSITFSRCVLRRSPRQNLGSESGFDFKHVFIFPLWDSDQS